MIIFGRVTVRTYRDMLRGPLSLPQVERIENIWGCLEGKRKKTRKRERKRREYKSRKEIQGIMYFTIATELVAAVGLVG